MVSGCSTSVMSRAVYADMSQVEKLVSLTLYRNVLGQKLCWGLNCRRNVLLERPNAWWLVMSNCVGWMMSRFHPVLQQLHEKKCVFDVRTSEQKNHCCIFYLFYHIRAGARVACRLCFCCSAVLCLLWVLLLVLDGGWIAELFCGLVAWRPDGLKNP